MNVESVSNFYNSRFQELGYSVSSVGWGSKESQYLRFETLIKGLDLNNKSVLDIGCGFGDLIEYLMEKNVNFSRYHGIDISSNILEFARLKYAKMRNVTFTETEFLKCAHKNFP